MTTKRDVLLAAGLRLLGVASVCLCAATSAWAQTSPVAVRPEDALKDLLRQQRQLDQQLGPAKPVDVQQAPAAKPGDQSAATVKFTLKKILLSKSAVLSQAALDRVTAKYIGREIVLNDLNGLIKEIIALYRQAGFPLGFAILPPQTIKDDTLQIVLIEPRVAGVGVNNAAYTDPAYLIGQIPAARGELVDIKGLEQALSLMRRKMVTGIQIAARLVPGDKLGTSRIVLDVVEPAHYSIATTADTYGTQASGARRNQTVLRNSGFLGRDDPLSLGFSLSQGSRSLFGTYDMPIGLSGLRVQAQASLSQGEVIGGNFDQLGLRSAGQFAALELRYPLLIDANRTVYGLLDGAYSNGSTTTGPLETGTMLGRYSAGIRAIRYEDTGTLEVVAKLVAIQSKAYDNVGDTYGNFLKTTGSLYATRQLGRFFVNGALNWQLTPDILLPSSEQFTMGGSGSLAAYELDQFNGDNGISGRLELQGPAGSVSQALGGAPGDFVVSPFVFVEGGAAVPYRAVGAKVRREDFATDGGAGINISLYSGTLNGKIAVAKSFDDIHKPLLLQDPKFIFELSSSLRF